MSILLNRETVENLPEYKFVFDGKEFIGQIVKNTKNSAGIHMEKGKWAVPWI